MTKKAKEIKIVQYHSNILVFAVWDTDSVSGSGRVYTIDTDRDSIPSPSYIPTMRKIWEEAEYITLAQAREIKKAIKSKTNF